MEPQKHSLFHIEFASHLISYYRLKESKIREPEISYCTYKLQASRRELEPENTKLRLEKKINLPTHLYAIPAPLPKLEHELHITNGFILKIALITTQTTTTTKPSIYMTVIM